MYDQVFRLVQSFGPRAMARSDDYLATTIEHMRSWRFPEVTVLVAIGTGGDGEVSNPPIVKRGVHAHLR